MANKNLKKIGILKVHDATLYYEVRGKGPILLMIPAAGCDANSYVKVAYYLSDWYTVVTYDRRGYSRSKINSSEKIPTVESNGDDAHCLLDMLSNEPANVYGSSAGAIIALDLVARYPEQVRILIAHEPPKAPSLTPQIDKEINLSGFFKCGGIKAVQEHIGVNLNEKKLVVERDDIRRKRNMKFFIEKEPKSIVAYKFNLDALKVAAIHTQIIIGGSTTAKKFIGYRGAIVASNFFKTNIIEFPGDHLGYLSFPKKYADKLHEVFEEKTVK